MEERFDFSQVPHYYPMCLNRECTQAETCLRQLVEQHLPTEVQHWLIINPKFMATQEDPCPHYRPAVKIQHAKGFIHILENLPHKQMQRVIYKLMLLFGRRTYYRVRKGERLLSPDEQQLVFNILNKCGVSPSPQFDAYKEDYDW